MWTSLLTSNWLQSSVNQWILVQNLFGKEYFKLWNNKRMEKRRSFNLSTTIWCCILQCTQHCHLKYPFELVFVWSFLSYNFLYCSHVVFLIQHEHSLSPSCRQCRCHFYCHYLICSVFCTIIIPIRALFFASHNVSWFFFYISLIATCTFFYSFQIFIFYNIFVMSYWDCEKNRPLDNLILYLFNLSCHPYRILYNFL